MGVIVVSIAMIAISLVTFSYAVWAMGPTSALSVMPILLLFSAVAYLAVIKEPRRLTEQRMANCGMVTGAEVRVDVDEETLVAQIGDQTVKWPRDKITHYRTPRGLMLVPETFVYLFLPSRGQFDKQTYRAISKLFRGK